VTAAVTGERWCCARCVARDLRWNKLVRKVEAGNPGVQFVEVYFKIAGGAMLLHHEEEILSLLLDVTISNQIFCGPHP